MIGAYESLPLLGGGRFVRVLPEFGNMCDMDVNKTNIEWLIWQQPVQQMYRCSYTMQVWGGYD